MIQIRFGQDERAGLRISCLVIAGLAAVTIIASFVLALLDPSLAWIARVTAKLSYHPAGQKCALCGMSHSFCALARGDLAQALAWNSFGPALYGVFCLWIGFGIYLFIKRR